MGRGDQVTSGYSFAKQEKNVHEQKKVINLENHRFKCTFFGGTKNSVAIERKFGDPKMYPKSEAGVKIESKVKKLVFYIKCTKKKT